MNLTHDAMLVSLRITAWSGRLYDRESSNHVAARDPIARRTCRSGAARRSYGSKVGTTMTTLRSAPELSRPNEDRGHRTGDADHGSHRHHPLIPCRSPAAIHPCRGLSFSPAGRRHRLATLPRTTSRLE